VTDLTYAAVKASIRKGELMTDQQLTELASSRDLKDLVNRVKEKYPSLVSVTTQVKQIEDALTNSYRDEVEQFMKAAPEIASILAMAKREVDEFEAVEFLKIGLGIIVQEGTEGQKRLSKDELLHQLVVKGFSSEVNEATKIYDKYNVPALIDSVFAKQRILKMMNATTDVSSDVLEGLKEYLRLKIDIFNLDILLRGIKNNIDRKALDEVLIYGGGSLPRESLKEVLKQPDLDKVLLLIESTGLAKVDSARALERSYEKKISELMSRTYYNGYLETGAVLGYLELKFREIKDIIRIANSVSRGIDPKRIVQEFIF
jgi:vacuolar-type H+-ATPase subunit C/Vma6